VCQTTARDSHIPGIMKDKMPGNFLLFLVDYVSSQVIKRHLYSLNLSLFSSSSINLSFDLYLHVGTNRTQSMVDSIAYLSSLDNGHFYINRAVDLCRRQQKEVKQRQ
jgi:hypothetical protein